MERVTVFITQSQNRFLEEAATSLEIGVSEVLRRVLESFIRDEQAKKKLLDTQEPLARRPRRALAGARS